MKWLTPKLVWPTQKHNTLFCAVLGLFLLVAAAKDTCRAQNLLSARRVGIASPTGMSSLHPAALRANPALAAGRAGQSAIRYSPARFGMSELSYAELALLGPVAEGWYGAGWLAGLGNELYNEFTLGALAAGRFSPLLRGGAALEMSRLGIRDSETEVLLQIHCGAVLAISSQLNAGIALHNLNRAAPESNSGSFDQKALLGVAYNAAYNLCFEAGMLILLEHSSAFSLAGVYGRAEEYRLRLAVQSKPIMLETGAALHLGDFDVIAALGFHEQLGLSQEFGIAFQWQ